YCPNCGATLVVSEIAGRQRPACPECGFVYYHNPIPAVGVLIEMEGGLVLIRRGHPPHQGRWALPSGFIEADESVEVAAMREAQEETGLEIALKGMVGVFSFPDGPPTSGIIVFYRARVVGGELCAGDDADEVRIFPADALPEMPFRTHRQAVHRWRVARQRGEVVTSHHAHAVEREDFFIREALPADGPRVLELASLLPGKIDPDPDAHRAAQQRLAESPMLLVFVAETYGPDPHVIGFVALSRIATLTGTLGWMDGMVVDPAFRRIGVGAALLEATLRRATRLGMEALYVNTQRASEIAVAFYRSSGFQEGRITLLRLKA
ncbi:MAG: GNAT family N-acetyltransferase, partial [Anaerolineae bacterium]|nr:GNAT family N-acetyltransferase [Anaerolineae bacterium]